MLTSFGCTSTSPAPPRAIATPLPASTAAAEPVTLDLLRSYSAWLHFERRFLSWELCGDDKSRFDVADAVVWARNPGFSFHKGGDQPPPSTQAAVVLSAVGCGWKEGPFTGR
jgi:hypothetical protein